MASRLAPDEALGSISRQYHHPALARQERRAHGLAGLLLLDRLAVALQLLLLQIVH